MKSNILFLGLALGFIPGCVSEPVREDAVTEVAAPFQLQVETQADASFRGKRFVVKSGLKADEPVFAEYRGYVENALLELGYHLVDNPKAAEFTVVLTYDGTKSITLEAVTDKKRHWRTVITTDGKTLFPNALTGALGYVGRSTKGPVSVTVREDSPTFLGLFHAVKGLPPPDFDRPILANPVFGDTDRKDRGTSSLTVEPDVGTPPEELPED